LFDNLTTPRLTLEPWCERHTETLVRLASNPAITRYIGDGRPWPESRSVQLSAAIHADWDRHGFGWRVAIDRRTNTPVGMVILSFAGPGAGIAADEYEIGWWLDPDAWGRGLAREGATAICHEAFTRIAASSVVARIQPANRPSLAVAAALGMQRESDSHGRSGEAIVVLRLTAATWRANAEPGPGRPPPARRVGPA
jgi:RimJ/RimL family protein N-acetyltransferase